MAIKILRIYSRINLGGPIYNVAYLTKYLAPEYETKLLLGPILQDEISAEHLLSELGIEYTILNEMRRSPNPILDFKCFLKIRKIIKEFKPDIIHTHTAKAGAIGRLAAFSCGIPIIVHTFHGHVFHSYFSKPVTWFVKNTERCLAKLTTAIVTISEIQKEEIGNTYKITRPDKIKIIPLGLDLDKFSKDTEKKRIHFRTKYGLIENNFAIAQIGRFAPIKNHNLLFETLSILKNHYPNKFENMIIFLVGDGDLKSNFQNILTNYEIPFSEENKKFQGGGVVFTSWIKNVEDVMAGFDAVILTSHNEGTPLSLIEAQATGIPVISTRVGGVENVVIDGVTGIIVPAGDKQEFAKAILKLMDERKTCISMGEQGKSFATNNFSYNRLADDMNNLYKDLLIIKNK